jgi:anti-anti-sigma factor
MPYAGVFHLTVEVSGATSHLRLMGEFDRAAVGRVENALDRVFQAPTTRRVVFDLRRLIFLDAAGLRTILRANERARARDFELVVQGREERRTASSRSPAPVRSSAWSMSQRSG